MNIFTVNSNIVFILTAGIVYFTRRTMLVSIEVDPDMIRKNMMSYFVSSIMLI